MTELTKWPRLLVHGDPVSREQANEILIRTDSWYFGGNDRAWEQRIYDVLGVKYEMEPYGPRVDYQDLRRVEEECRTLNLEYLVNSQIISAYIGGPHGWCDWNGNIGCSTYNIGKWPDVETVDSEWKLIAQAFPYLRLRCQLVPEEGEALYPACEWMVEKGEANLVEPTGLLRPINDTLQDNLVNLFAVGRERGVTVQRLTEAFEQVRAA